MTLCWIIHFVPVKMKRDSKQRHKLKRNVRCLHHVAYSKIKNQYHIQTDSSRESKWHMDFNRFTWLATIIKMLRKQFNTSGKTSTLAAQLQQTSLSMVVPSINSVNICHLPVDNIGSILAVQYCHMVPLHTMHLNLLLTALQHNMKDVNSHHIMANPLHNSRPFCFVHIHLYSSDGKLDFCLSKLYLITQKLIVKNTILILHADWHINFPLKSKNINRNQTFIMQNSSKNTVMSPLESQNLDKHC